MKACFLAIGWLTAAAGMAAVPPKPNIVFILADDLGWADISSGSSNYGNPSDYHETPNLERLAREGLSFTSTYTCPNCSPTRAGFLSGMYAPRPGNGVYNVDSLNRGNGTPPLVAPEQNEDVPAATRTFAEMLHEAGYVTAHFGKYHVGGHEGGGATLPLNQGYDLNFGGSNAGAPGSYWAAQTGGVWTFQGGIGTQLDPYASPYDAAYLAAYKTYAPPYYTMPISLLGTAKHVGDGVTDAALAFMASQLASNRPFYVQFHEYLVHTPNHARPDLLAKYQAKPAGTRHNDPVYAAMIEQFDHSVGRLLRFITDPNGDGNPSDSRATNTLVIFTSDNGGDSRTVNTPLKGNKGMFSEGGFRVPMVAWMPGVVPVATNDTMIQMVDLYPTLCEIAGGTMPDPLVQPHDGVSWASLLTAPQATLARDTLYWHFPGYLDDRATPCTTLIRLLGGKRYKLMFFYEDRRYELYNLTDDLSETTDLWADAGGRAANWGAATNLSAAMRAWLDAVVDNPSNDYPSVRATGEIVPPPEPISSGPPKAVGPLDLSFDGGAAEFNANFVGATLPSIDPPLSFVTNAGVGGSGGILYGTGADAILFHAPNGGTSNDLIRLGPGESVTLSLDVLIDDPTAGATVRLGLGESLQSVIGTAGAGNDSLIGVFSGSATKTMVVRTVDNGVLADQNGTAGGTLQSNRWYRMVADFEKTTVSNQFLGRFDFFDLGVSGTSTPAALGFCTAAVNNAQLAAASGYAGFRLATTSGRSGAGGFDNFRISLGPEIRLTAFQRAGGAAVLTWNSRPATAYHVDISTNLTHWAGSIYTQAATGPFSRRLDASSTPTRVYRVRQTD